MLVSVIESTGSISSNKTLLDPHPGNIFVRKNKSSGKVEIVLLDHGLYEQIPDKMRNDFCHFWEAIVLKDYDLMKKYSESLNVKGKFKD